MSAVAACIAAAAVAIVGWPPSPDVRWALPLLALLLVTADRLRVRVRIGDQVDAVNLVEAVVAPLLFAYTATEAIAVVVVAQLLIAVCWPGDPVKRLFNLAQWVTAVGAGGLLLRALHPDPALDAGRFWALLAAVALVGAVNLGAFFGVLCLARHERPLRMARSMARVIALAWVGGWALNVLIGSLYALAYAASPGAVVLFAVPLVVLHLAYRGVAAATTSEQRLAGAHAAVALLAAPVDPHDALDAFLDAVATTFAAPAAAVVLTEGDRWRSCHADRAGDGRRPTAALLEALGALADAVRVDRRSHGPLADAVRAGGWSTCLAAPLEGQGCIVVLDPHQPDGSDRSALAVLAALAREAAGVLAKGQLLAEVLDERAKVADLTEERAAARAVVDQLQQAVVPPQPALAGVELAVEYLPSDDSAPTGGDLFDWQVLPDGDLHLAVVDVLGHGVQATRAALAVVHTLRAVVADGTPLEAVVARADELLAAQGSEVVATVVVARYQPSNGVVRIASGGHPPALVIGTDGTVTVVEAPGVAIGWPLAGSDSVSEHRLGAGDTVLLYTDGLVEAKRDLLQGLETLVAHAATTADVAAATLPAALVGQVMQEAERRDDTLALVLRREATPDAFRRVVAARPDAVAPARRALAAWVAGGGRRADDVELVASELLGNAVRAGRRSVVVEAGLEADHLTLVVRDDGPGDPVVADRGWRLPDADAESGRGLAIVRALCSEVDARSEPAGTTVRCVVPLPAPATPAAPATPGTRLPTPAV